MVVGGPSGDVINHKGACGTPVVRPGDRPKTLLACSVPDLQFYLLTRNLDDSGAELDTYGMRTVGHDCKDRAIEIIDVQILDRWAHSHFFSVNW